MSGSKITVEDFKTLFSKMDRTSRQKINEGIKNLNHIMN